jgi:hypothetical protein
MRGLTFLRAPDDRAGPPPVRYPLFQVVSGETLAFARVADLRRSYAGWVPRGSALPSTRPRIVVSRSHTRGD